MAGSFSGKIIWTEDPMVFQRQCLLLFQSEIDDPGAEIFGTTGQKQNGIDLLGRRINLSSDYWVGGQCKLLVKGTSLNRRLIIRDAESALSIAPQLREFIVLTNAPNDVAIQQLAAELTTLQAGKGRDFRVSVWGAETIAERAARNPDVFRQFFPDALPQMGTIIEGQERLVDLGERTSDTLAAIYNLLVARPSFGVGGPRDTDPKRADDEQFELEINTYRTLLEDGHPRLALTKFEELLTRVTPDSPSRTKFRIVANVGASKLALGRESEAAVDFLKAYEFDPTNARARSRKGLALILQGRFDEAHAWAESCLLDAEIDRLTYIVWISASSHLSDAQNPVPQLPPELLDPEVEAAIVDLFRLRPEFGDWKEYAQEARSRFPESNSLRRMAADAALQAAIDWSHLHGSRTLDGPIRTSLTEAADTLYSIWLQQQAGGPPMTDFAISIAANLATAYRLLDDHSSAVETLRQVETLAPGNAEIAKLQLAVAMESNNPKLAISALTRAPPDRDHMLARLNLAVQQAQWTEALGICSEPQPEDMDRTDECVVACVRLICQFNLRTATDIRKDVGDLVSEWSDKVVAPIYMYGIARRLRDRAWCRKLYNAALTLRSDLDSASRRMLAGIAVDEEDPRTVIELLNGYTSTLKDSDELRMLTSAFVNTSATQAAVDFVASLPKDLSSDVFYSRSVAAIKFNYGDLVGAEQAFERTVEAMPKDAVAQFGLLQALLRQDRTEKVRHTLEKLRVERLEGDPTYLLGIAQLLIAFDNVKDGLRLAYFVTTKHRGNAEIEQLYMGCILAPQVEGKLERNIQEVEIGTEVWLKSLDSQTKLVAIVDEIDPSMVVQDTYDPNHPLASALLGHVVGDEVELMPSAGAAQTWSIESVTSKYLALWDRIRDTFPSRFPENQSFQSFKIEDGDIAPILEQVKRRSEHIARIEELYQTAPMPMSAISAGLGTTTIEFASMVASKSLPVITCVGTHVEREAAVAVLKSAQNGGLVLDTLAIWTVYALNVLPQIKKMFGRVVIAQSTIDDLRQYRDRSSPLMGNRSQMSMSYDGTTFYRTEVTAEEAEKRHQYLEGVIEQIRQQCEIAPVAAPDNLSEVEATLLREFGAHILDAYFLARDTELPLISEDLRLRRLSEISVSVRSAWIQPVLMLLNAEKLISAVDYAIAIANLADAKHSTVSIHAIDLLSLAGSDGSDAFRHFKTLTMSLGGPSAEFESHMSVLASALGSVVALPIGDDRKKYWGALLERIADMYRRRDMLTPGLRSLRDNPNLPSELRDYVARWVVGHFIDLDGASG